MHLQQQTNVLLTLVTKLAVRSATSMRTMYLSSHDDVTFRRPPTDSEQSKHFCLSVAFQLASLSCCYAAQELQLHCYKPSFIKADDSPSLKLHKLLKCHPLSSTKHSYFAHNVYYQQITMDYFKYPAKAFYLCTFCSSTERTAQSMQAGGL